MVVLLVMLEVRTVVVVVLRRMYVVTLSVVVFLQQVPVGRMQWVVVQGLGLGFL